MTQYIDKDAVIAEIEKQGIIQPQLSWFTDKLIQIINYCLEVKEVDLEDYYHKFLEREWFGKHCNRTASEMMAFTAKHFFELGLKVNQKGSVK